MKRIKITIHRAKIISLDLLQPSISHFSLFDNVMHQYHILTYLTNSMATGQ